MAVQSRTLASLVEWQRRLAARTEELGADPDDVLKMGTDVLEFAACEESAFFPLLPLLDPAAREELGAEHVQLVDDLQLLESLLESTPESPDVATLAAALAARLRTHIARDGRLLAQAVRLAGL